MSKQMWWSFFSPKCGPVEVSEILAWLQKYIIYWVLESKKCVYIKNSLNLEFSVSSDVIQPTVHLMT